MMRINNNSATFDPARMGFFPSDNGRMWLDCRFSAPLSAAGLVGFEQIMSKSDGRCEKSLVDREVWHMRIRVSDDKSRGLFLKKHHVRTWKSRLRALFGIQPSATPGRIEAANAAALTSAGIAVMRLIAYGEKVHADGLQESFVITEELENFTELPTYLRRLYEAPTPGRRSEADREVRRLISEIALIVRRFHAAGYNHRDLYCRHFFVSDSAQQRREIRLIDLQRVQRRRWLRRR
ncbi:MAG: lipopolysaccharide kinase InaA family protein, partial [Thermoguttaceae bacterium]